MLFATYHSVAAPRWNPARHADSQGVRSVPDCTRCAWRDKKKRRVDKRDMDKYWETNCIRWRANIIDKMELQKELNYVQMRLKCCCRRWRRLRWSCRCLLESKQQNNLSRAGITERTTCTIRIGVQVCGSVCVCGCVHKYCTANTESASEGAAAEYEL